MKIHKIKMGVKLNDDVYPVDLDIRAESLERAKQMAKDYAKNKLKSVEAVKFY